MQPKDRVLENLEKKALAEREEKLAKQQAEQDRIRQKAEDERRLQIEEKQLKLQRWSAIWETLNSLVALAGLVLSIIALSR